MLYNQMILIIFDKLECDITMLGSRNAKTGIHPN